MEKVDAKNLILGILISVAMSGLYETVFYGLQGLAVEATNSSVATLVSLVIVLVYFWVFFLRSENVGEHRTTRKGSAENAEETEQEKLRREFKQRTIT